MGPIGESLAGIEERHYLRKIAEKIARSIRDRPRSWAGAQYELHCPDVIRSLCHTGPAYRTTLFMPYVRCSSSRMLKKAPILTRPPRCAKTHRSTGKAAASEESEVYTKLRLNRSLQSDASG
jgi:hypothetical protein